MIAGHLFVGVLFLCGDLAAWYAMPQALPVWLFIAVVIVADTIYKIIKRSS